MLEHLGEHLLRDHAVLEHVRDARRHAQVVLEHVDRAVAIAHEIRAADVGPDAVRRLAADARRQKIRGRRDDVVGHDAVFDDAPVVVEIVDEVVQRLQPLDQAALDARPLRRLDRARDDVERPRAVDVLAFGVDREGDAHLDDRTLGIGLPLGERAHAQRRQIVGELGRRRPSRAGRGKQLVEEPAGLVLIPVDAHYFGSRYAQEKPKSTRRNSAARAAASTKPVPARGARKPRHAWLSLPKPALGTVAVQPRPALPAARRPEPSASVGHGRQSSCSFAHGMK